MDWGGLEQAARLVAGSGEHRDGLEVARLRKRILAMLDEARSEVAAESRLPIDPGAELLVLDRKAWVGGNVMTLQRLMGDIELSNTEAKLLALEGGALFGAMSRIVLAQFDPFRDRLIVVHSNLGDFADDSGLRWILLHELTHLAQFRAAPWMVDHIIGATRDLLSSSKSWTKQAAAELRRRLPEIARSVRDGRSTTGAMPLLELFPEPQRAEVMKLHSLVTVLEGHATHVTDLIAKREMPDYELLKARIEQRSQRRPIVRLLESISGIEMKRQQYVIGLAFCAEVWQHGGAAALAPAWAGPDAIPTPEELREPASWLKRVA